MRALLLCLTLIISLTACCAPGATLQTEAQSTAFAAEVVGISDSLPGVHLIMSRNAPMITAVITDQTRLVNREGGVIKLSELQGGQRVYVVGWLEGNRVIAQEIQLL